MEANGSEMEEKARKRIRMDVRGYGSGTKRNVLEES